MNDQLQEDETAESRFARTDEEAKQRFDGYKQKDPFPGILPSLLNSADISDYVAATGMIFPFYMSSLKSASYEAKLLGRYVYWDETGEKHDVVLKQDEIFSLKPNSIAFVNIEPTIRLPDYIALRFNLKITHVHRGLLLGTGPLIDPGFEGKILIPLHNLTTNEYTFKGGEGLVWMEFTKLSDNNRWENDDPLVRSGEYIPFPKTKKYRGVSYYLPKAAPHKSIRSSIPDVIKSAARSAEEAEDSANKAADRARSSQHRITIVGIIGLAALLVALGFGLITVYSLVEDLNSHLVNSRQQLNTLQNKIDYDVPRTLDIEIDRVRRLEKEVQELNSKIEILIGASRKNPPPMSE